MFTDFNKTNRKYSYSVIAAFLGMIVGPVIGYLIGANIYKDCVMTYGQFRCDTTRGLEAGYVSVIIGTITFLIAATTFFTLIIRHNKKIDAKRSTKIH